MAERYVYHDADGQEVYTLDEAKAGSPCTSCQSTDTTSKGSFCRCNKCGARFTPAAVKVHTPEGGSVPWVEMDESE